MQGLWKNSVGGWNHKDSKRKTQKRKHVIRDKGRALLNVDRRRRRKDENDGCVSIRYEGEVVFTPPAKVYKQSGWIEYWNVRIGKYGWCGAFATTEKVFQAVRHERGGAWCDAYTYEVLPNQNEIVPLILLEKEEVEYTNPIDVSKSWWHRSSNDELTFVYNKPLYDFERWRLYNDGRRRKHGQNIAHSKDRASVRKWISNGDWDAEIDTHALSKSISWWVH